MSKSQEQLDEELFASLLPTIDDMFGRIFPLFPAKMFCEAEEDIEDVVDEDDDGDEDEEEGDDQE